MRRNSNNGQLPDAVKTVASLNAGYARTTDKSVENPQIYSLLSRNNEMKRELTQRIYKNSIKENQQSTENFSAWISAQASGFTSGDHTPADLTFQFAPVFGASVSRLSAIGVGSESVSAQLSVNGVRKTITTLRRLNARPFADGQHNGPAVLERIAA